ncbi:MAG: hypothetical protein JW936_00035 [Sedimentisphaerales bacterium]|nr:hypothetical protein [Sedimentisphaerales bacterium]
MAYHKPITNHLSILVLLTILLLVSGGAALGQMPGVVTSSSEQELSLGNPLGNQDVMYTFDFEERLVNFEELPMHWSKVTGREGFLHYANGRLDNAHSRSGDWSFELIPNGGSVAYEFHPRMIPARPGSDFELVGYVHFEQATNCRAQLSCVLTDWRGDPIPGSFAASDLISPDDYSGDGWLRMEAYVPGNFPEARFIQPAIWVLQERQWRENIITEQEIIRGDVNALVWFDDIGIFQLPRVVLRTDRDTNVFASNETPVLEVNVEGVTSLDYEVHLTVRDAAGGSVYDDSWVLAGVTGSAGGRHIQMPRLETGIYHAELDILSAQTIVAKRYLTFAQLAPTLSHISDSGAGFGVLQLDDNVGPWDTAMELTRLCNARLVKVPVWRRQPEMPGAILTEDDFDTKLIELQQSSIELIATFSEVPDYLTRQLDLGRGNLLDVLTSDIPWRTEVATILAQYARQVPYWQIGVDIGRSELVWDPRNRHVVDALREEFEQLVGYSVLAVPLSSVFEVTRQQTGTDYAALSVLSSIRPEYIPEYFDGCRSRGLENIWATLYPLDQRYYGRENVLIDFAKRLAFAKSGDAEGIFVEHPWSQRLSSDSAVVEPTELFLVFRTAADLLGGTQYAGRFEIAPGIHALIFDRGGEGCLFAWDENYDPHTQGPPVAHEVFLGDNPVMVDLFGNSQPIITRNGIGAVAFSNWPVFLEGVNTPMAMFRASLSLSPEVLEASISSQRTTVSFRNPFNTVISGQLRFLGDSDRRQQWSVDPSVLNFTLQPHEEYSQEISVAFPRTELGGDKGLDLVVRVDADRTYTMLVRQPFEIRLEGIDVGMFTRRVGLRDLMVQLVVSNESEDEISLVCFADMPDLDHLEQPIPRLLPGAMATRTFLIPDAAKWIGRFVRVGLYDPRGTDRVNYQIEIN